jgi:hypothetical protein
MPPLPRSFQFSQASLQDFLDCQQRFNLHYRMGLRWPAIELEPVEDQERRMALGKAFHQLVQQHTVGLPIERIERASRAPDMAPVLADWWQNYLVYRPVDLFGGEDGHALVRSELTLTAFTGAYPLTVRYDLLVVVPEQRAIILDWKTSSRRAPEQVLAGRMQTRLYRFLLVEAGGSLNGGQQMDPEQVEMIYWFPEFPDSPARFPYSAVQYVEDEGYLAHLIEKIVAMGDGDFEMTDDKRQCRACMYRSYCDRGVRAGALDDVAAAWDLQEQDASLEVDFDRIAEIEY